MEHNQFLQLVENAINAFNKQGQFSRGEFGNKCYYLHEGLCCIVGHMMPDEHTRVRADNQDETNILSLYDSGFDWAKQFNSQQIDLLADLQSIHDTGFSMDVSLVEMKYRFRQYQLV